MHDLYGFVDGELDLARVAVEQALDIHMRPAQNEYRGAHYYYECKDGGSLLLQRNWDPLDRECMEEQFPEMRVLLYASGACMANAERRLASVAAVRLLVRQRGL